MFITEGKIDEFLLGQGCTPPPPDAAMPMDFYTPPRWKVSRRSAACKFFYIPKAF
jgi:hypothetical protein